MFSIVPMRTEILSEIRPKSEKFVRKLMSENIMSELKQSELFGSYNVEPFFLIVHPGKSKQLFSLSINISFVISGAIRFINLNILMERACMFL